MPQKERRRLLFKRMRKVMIELDRIYFQPVFHKRYQQFLTYKQKKLKALKKTARNRFEPTKPSTIRKPQAAARASEKRNRYPNRYQGVHKQPHNLVQKSVAAKSQLQKPNQNQLPSQNPPSNANQIPKQNQVQSQNITLNEAECGKQNPNQTADQLLQKQNPFQFTNQIPIQKVQNQAENQNQIYNQSQCVTESRDQNEVYSKNQEVRQGEDQSKNKVENRTQIARQSQSVTPSHRYQMKSQVSRLMQVQNQILTLCRLQIQNPNVSQNQDIIRSQNKSKVMRLIKVQNRILALNRHQTKNQNLMQTQITNQNQDQMQNKHQIQKRNRMQNKNQIQRGQMKSENEMQSQNKIQNQNQMQNRNQNQIESQNRIQNQNQMEIQNQNQMEIQNPIEDQNQMESQNQIQNQNQMESQNQIQNRNQMQNQIQNENHTQSKKHRQTQNAINRPRKIINQNQIRNVNPIQKLKNQGRSQNRYWTRPEYHNKSKVKSKIQLQAPKWNQNQVKSYPTEAVKQAKIKNFIQNPGQKHNYAENQNRIRKQVRVQAQGRHRGRDCKRFPANDNKVDANDQSRRVKVSRIMRLFLESRKIIIYRKKRKNRLMPCKPSRERKNFARVAFDMPATDPTYDVTFSTDDELCGDHSNKTSNCLQPPSHKMLLQSELQRRYIDEIGDNSRLGKGEPPELKRQNETGRHGLLLSQTYKPPTTAPTRADYKFPHLSPGRDYMSLRRTSSWHDVNNEEAKRLPKRHPASPTRGSKDDLHTRLSLKKKIWTGVPADSTNYFESNRTAFWGNSQTAALRAGLRSGNAATAHSKAKKMEEHEAFTNTCPEKIMALKEVSTLLNSDAMPARDRMTLNIVVPEINIEQRTLHVFQQLSKLSRESLGCHSTSLQAQGRQLRRKKNPMTETTQLLGRLYKPGKSRSNISMQRLKSRNTPCRATPMRLVPELRQCNNQQRPRLKLPPSDKTSRTKFRTNGLMATTVQSSNVRRSKLLSAYKAPSQLTEPMTAIVARNRTSNQQVTASSGSTSTQPAETTKRNLKQWKPTTRVQPAAKQEDEVATAAPPTRRTQANASERIPEGKKRIRDILH